jgi:hypothetical protein
MDFARFKPSDGVVAGIVAAGPLDFVLMTSADGAGDHSDAPHDGDAGRKIDANGGASDSHLHAVTQRLDHFNDLVSIAKGGITLLDELETQHSTVAAKTRQLHANCKQLLEEQVSVAWWRLYSFARAPPRWHCGGIHSDTRAPAGCYVVSGRLLASLRAVPPARRGEEDRGAADAL